MMRWIVSLNGSVDFSIARLRQKSSGVLFVKNLSTAYRHQQKSTGKRCSGPLSYLEDNYEKRYQGRWRKLMEYTHKSTTSWPWFRRAVSTIERARRQAGEGGIDPKGMVNSIRMKLNHGDHSPSSSITPHFNFRPSSLRSTDFQGIG